MKKPMLRVKHYLCLLSTLLIGGCSTTLPHARVPLAQITPAITAQDNDPAWANAVATGPLTPSLGTRPQDLPLPDTHVQLLWDAQWLYIRFRCIDVHLNVPFGITHDAKHFKGDVVEVFIDPVGDGRQYVEVQVNPLGGVMDVLHFVTTDALPTSTPVLPKHDWDTEHWGLVAWDMPELRTAVSSQPSDDAGLLWITDIAIPANLLRRLGVNHFSPGKMRANFLRLDGPVDPHTHKRLRLISSNWSVVPAGLPHLAPGSMGILELASLSTLSQLQTNFVLPIRR
jgi:hypothetical protein